MVATNERPSMPRPRRTNDSLDSGLHSKTWYWHIGAFAVHRRRLTSLPSEPPRAVPGAGGAICVPKFGLPGSDWRCLGFAEALSAGLPRPKSSNADSAVGTRQQSETIADFRSLLMACPIRFGHRPVERSRASTAYEAAPDFASDGLLYGATTTNCTWL